ncbi:MAG: hypothetical protein U0R19_27485 [Bryobacteraceae bacterium]
MVSTAGVGDRKIATGLDWAIAPIWTRDGTRLLLWSGEPSRGTTDYWAVPVGGGKATKTGIAERLAAAKAKSVLDILYNTNPSPVAATAGDDVVIAARFDDTSDLWMSPIDGGKKAAGTTRITVGAGAMHPSVAANGRIAFSRVSVNQAIWMLPLDADSGKVTGEARRLEQQVADVRFPNVSADGKRLAYVSNRGGDQDVWVREIETGEERQLTFTKEDEVRAMISPDGSRVAFALKGDFYLAGVNGGSQSVVCKGCGRSVAGWTPDGKSLVYYYFDFNPPRHATVDIATGKKRDLIRHEKAVPTNARISPDGRWITLTLVATGQRDIYVSRMEDGTQPELWIRISRQGQADNSFWSTDGNLLYIQQSDALWAQRLAPKTKTPLGEPILVKRFDGPRYRPRFSASGLARTALYFTMEETTSNVWIADPVY